MSWVIPVRLACCKFPWNSNGKEKKKKKGKGPLLGWAMCLAKCYVQRQCASTSAHLMFLYLHAQIKHCQTGKAQGNEKDKAGMFVRALKETSSPSAEVPTKLPCHVRTGWNFKHWYFLVKNAWSCFWAAELWVESKCLSARGDCTMNQPNMLKHIELDIAKLIAIWPVQSVNFC